MKKRVLHLLFTSEFGGAEKVAMDIIKLSSDYTESYYMSKTGNIEKILNREKIQHISTKKINYTSIKKIVNKYKIDIIHAHDFKASLLASLFSKKCKVVSHIHQSPSWLSVKNIKTTLFTLTAKRFSSILVTSEEIKTIYPYKKCREKFVVLDNYVYASNEGDYEKIYDFIFVGRLEDDKNPFKFLEYIELLKNEGFPSKSIMIGKGQHLEYIKTIIVNKNLDINVMGFKDNPYPYISESKFMVVTSQKEGFGIAIIESMQLGVPVITKRIGGVTENLDDSNAIIIDSFNKIDDQVIELQKNLDRYNEMSNNAQLFGRQFSNKSKIKNILKEIYNGK